MTSSFIHFFQGPASSFSNCFCFLSSCFFESGLATVSEELELLLSELFCDCEYSEPAKSRVAAEMPTVGYARKAGGNFIESMTSNGAGVLLQSTGESPDRQRRDAESPQLVSSGLLQGPNYGFL